ncbi:hypothetical protein HELRODRAFT_174487 [Helobdella robusta]|uniref:Caspase family p20 domain-containing protein n=1 Tax=Helobdella robusta TaxID=6412 RepID=T1F864_HELRO|nr:hypothetical protein HELRODRAFT_174487 [Helobdella robusta]ESO01531.1 hypothetical protein HELRODRAFT_174487 [Helobdella robusta]
MPSQRKTTAPSPQQALNGQGMPRIPGKYAIAEGCFRKIQNGPSMVLRLRTLNVGSLIGHSMEIAEMLERRRIDICCLQETRWKSNGVCHVNSDKEKYKLFWNGQKTAKNVVGIFVREPLAQEVLDIKRINSRLMWIKLRIEKQTMIFSACAPQTGESEEMKNDLNLHALETTNKVALIIGNASYRTYGYPLPAVRPDMFHTTKLFEEMGFKVISLLDLTLSEMKRAVACFCNLLSENSYG